MIQKHSPMVADGISKESMFHKPYDIYNNNNEFYNYYSKINSLNRSIIFNDNLQLLPWNAFVVWVEKNHGND